MNKNIIIAASGTGGHIYPGISIANEFKGQGYNPVFFLSDNAASMEIIKNSGFDYVVFNVSGMPRKFSLSFLLFFFKISIAVFKAAKHILKLSPAAVIGTGGYVSVPAVVAAGILGKKTFIHEQNMLPGAANKFLGKITDKTFISFKESSKYFKSKNTFISGYPVRKDIFGVSKKEGCKKLGLAENLFTVLVFGGSLGAAKLNEVTVAAAGRLSAENLQVIHITGQKNYAKVKDAVKNKSNYKLFDYMHDIKYAYAASDIAVCRSGAGAVFELQALNKPAVLVPYPYATDNHQYLNAKAVEKPGFIEIIEEKDLTPEILANKILEIKVHTVNANAETPKTLPQEIIFEEIIKITGDKK